MKLSTKGRYGLRALIDLALYSENETVSIASISARQNISESYLEQLIAKLRKAGLVTSVRGAGGGYKLALPASEISVGDILRALEGSLDAVNCPGLEEESSCGGSEFCVTCSFLAAELSFISFSFSATCRAFSRAASLLSWA